MNVMLFVKRFLQIKLRISRIRVGPKSNSRCSYERKEREKSM